MSWTDNSLTSRNILARIVWKMRLGQLSFQPIWAKTTMRDKQVTDLETSPLLPSNVFDELMAEVVSRLEAIEQGPSAYRTFAELASTYQRSATAWCS